MVSKSTRIRRIVLLVLLGVWATILVLLRSYVQSPTEATDASFQLHADVVTVPLRMVYGYPVVDVMIDGQGPFPFLLDTATCHTVVSRELADNLDLPETESTAVLTDARGVPSEKLELVHVDSLAVGGAVCKRFEAITSELDWAVLSYIDPELQGILGLAFFWECLITIDFPNQQLTFTKGFLPAPDGKEILPLKEGELCATISARIGQNEFDVMIDTGNKEAVILQAEIANQLPMHTERFQASARSAGGILSRAVMARIAAPMYLGMYVVQDPTVSWYTNHPGENLLGMEILQHFTVTIDMSNKRVRFARDDEGPVFVSGVRSIGLVFEVRHDVALNVTEAQAAELGVSTEDEVDMIDGTPVSDLDLETLVAVCEEKERVVARIRRGDQTFEVEAPIVTTGRTAYIRDIIPGSPAAEVNLEMGDEVQRIDGEPFPTSDNSNVIVTSLYREKERLILHIRRGEEEFDVEVPVVELLP